MFHAFVIIVFIFLHCVDEQKYNQNKIAFSFKMFKRLCLVESISIIGITVTFIFKCI